MNPREYARFCQRTADELPRQRWSETDPSRGVGIAGALHLGGGRFADLDFGSDVLTRDVVLVGLNEMGRLATMLTYALDGLDELARAGSEEASDTLVTIERRMHWC